MAHCRRSILSWLLALGCAAASAAPADQMRHLAKGVSTEPRASNDLLVFHTADDLVQALNQASGRDVASSVDFEREIVVGVMLSNRPTGCAGVDITSIAQDGIVSVVHYRERKARKGETCHGTLYSPFDFVVVAKTNAPWRFMQDPEP